MSFSVTVPFHTRKGAVEYPAGGCAKTVRRSEKESRTGHGGEAPAAGQTRAEAKKRIARSRFIRLQIIRRRRAASAKRRSWHWDQQRLADHRGQAVEHVHEARGEPRNGAQLPKMFGVLPCRLPRRAHAPGAKSIFQMGGRREIPAWEADIQGELGGFDEAVKSGIQRGVVGEIHSTGIRSRSGEVNFTDY